MPLRNNVSHHEDSSTSHSLVKRLSLQHHSKRRRDALIAVAVVLAVIIAVQLAYPIGRGLPLARVGETSVALASHDAMAKSITDAFAASKLELTIGSDKSVQYPLRLAGAEPNTEAMIARLSDYPLWQRLIPGSLLLPSHQATVADVYYTAGPLKEFAAARSSELSFPFANARLAIKDGKVVATAAKQGSSVSGDQVAAAINNASIVLGGTTTVVVPAKRIPPQRTSKDLLKVQGQAEAALKHNITVTAEGKQFSPDKTEVASWVVLSTAQNGDVSLSIDKDKIKAYLTTLNDHVGTPAGQTDITIVDGKEVSRTTGAVGRAINVNILADQLAAKLLVPTQPETINETAQFTPVQPSVIFNSKYTTTQSGLQAYINDVARDKNMHISIRQLDGAKWAADARATESIPSGSTYKLFVALVLFDKMDKGEISWDDPMLDTNVAGCFERMTVPSTNPCAEKWIAEFGRQYINDFIYARGFSHGTTFIAPDATHTTAADLTKFMIGLNDGTLIGGAHRDRLLDSLGRHPYRYGIPTGSAGVVHDKVGFLWDYVHDTAIVQHPKGTYVMTIMSKGQSYAAIAAVTRQIERIMYP